MPKRGSSENPIDIDAYARRTRARTRPARRNSSAYNRTAVKTGRTSRANPAVARALRPRRAPTKSNRNLSAIYTLGRQVALLQSQKFGILQKNTQYVKWIGTVLPATLPDPASPILFSLNDFYNQTAFRGRITGTTGTFDVGPVFTPQTYDVSLDDAQEFTARQNTELVSPNHYLPVMTRVNMTFNFRWTGVSPPGYIRIDVLKVKDINQTNKIQCNLPTTLGAYRFLAQPPSDPLRNYYNTDFQQVYSTKWLKCSNPCRLATESAQLSIKHTMSRKFSHRDFLSPQFNDNPTGQEFWTNVPRNQQLWVLISVDTNAAVGLVSIDTGKLNMWRDAHSQV